MKIRRSGIAVSRSLMRKRAGAGLFRALCGLGELLQNPVALQLRQVVDEQHAVQMVDLVLDAGCEQPFRLFLMHLAVKVRKRTRTFAGRSTSS